MICNDCLGTGIDPDERFISGDNLPCLSCHGRGMIDTAYEEDDWQCPGEET